MATGPTIRFLIALRNLVKNGDIKTIEQAYDFAKREFGELTTIFKKQIQKTFDNVKKPTVGTPAKKEGSVTPIREGIETLADAKVADEVSPVLDRLSKAVEDANKQMKEIELLSDADMQKKQIQNALRSLRNRRIYEMSSGVEGDVRTALRQFVKKELETGKLDIPDAYEKKMILEDRQGGVDPIDVFRKAYGEDALIAVDDVFEQYGSRLRGPTFRDIEENFRKLFKMNRGFYDMADLPVPKKEYGFEPGLRSVDSVEEDLMKQYKQLDELDKFEPSVDRKPNAEGGIIELAEANEITNKNLTLPKAIEIFKRFNDGKEPTMKELLDFFKKSPRYQRAAKGGRVQASSGGLADILKL
jgi:hypothetical protein